MYGVQKQQLRHLTQNEHYALKILCHLAKNMYNVGLYHVRQYFFKTKEFLNYPKNNKFSKNNENYKLLNTDVAQQILKKVEENFQSFFGLLKAKKSNKVKQKVNIPQYLEKKGYFELTFPRVKIQDDGSFYLPMSPAFKKQFGKVKIKLPSNLSDKKICEVRIQPKYNASFFEVEYVYEVEKVDVHLDYSHALAVDLGLSNFATCIDTNGASFILDGKPLKSFNHWYNKENARLQRINDKQGITSLTKRQVYLLKKRTNKIHDYLNKSVRYIINHCLEHNIGKIVAGQNKQWKQGLNLGKKNNQQFIQIPHGLFLKKLESMCLRYGIVFVPQEESYTSKASFLDGDIIPVYGEKDEKTVFSGKRVKRGLYQSKNGLLVNADSNGAANILRKSNHRSMRRVAMGFLTNPIRIRLVS